ncbi:hypothetical protein [uncultured Nocardioides sp.]|nr:hypothetical protein [uncultured Nocardioides sp.]
MSTTTCGPITLNEAVAAVVAAAPPLTDDQRAQLAGLLRPDDELTR